ncbi:MAG: IclR family transcriptional regulator [Galactobacter sp.]
MPRVSTGESMPARLDRLLGAFDAAHPTLRVAQLARRAGLPVPTASRLVAQLVEIGWLERCEEGLRPGLRLWELGQFAAPVRDFREAALPALHGVHAVARQHAQLAVLDGTDVLVLERLSAKDATVNYSVQGGRLPAHASSSGLALLAHNEAAAEATLLRRLERFTQFTTTDPARFRSLLTEVRAQGVAVLEGAIDVRTSAVAVPVFRGGQAWGALSVIVPNDGEAKRWVPLLKAAARSIEAGSEQAAESVWDETRRTFISRHRTDTRKPESQ